jgi:3-hydroxy acid dehydrogenase/malonic semialdehyde reductase
MLRNIVITGATSGIGLATAKLLAEKAKPAKLILTGRRADRLEKIRLELSEKTSVETHVFDIRSREECAEFVKKIENTPIDSLINNAGLAAGRESIQAANIDDWETMIDTNVKGLLYVTRGILPGMLKRKAGHIVNLGSIAGHAVYPNGNVYCATKYAVKALTEALRVDTLGSGVRVSSVDPGMVETEFSLVRFKGDKEKAKIVYEGLKPLSPQDIADAIYWCLSRPEHVNIQEVILTPTAQASTRDIART